MNKQREKQTDLMTQGHFPSVNALAPPFPPAWGHRFPMVNELICVNRGAIVKSMHILTDEEIGENKEEYNEENSQTVAISIIQLTTDVSYVNVLICILALCIV